MSTRRRIKSGAAVKTRIQLSETGKSYEVHLSTNGMDYRVYKSGFKSVDTAIKESVSLKGHFRLWNDIIDNKK